MKKIILLLISSLFISFSFGQITKKGVIQGFVPGFAECDTVLILGKIDGRGKDKYFVQALENGYFGKTFVSENKIELLPDTLNFWENIWFNTILYEYTMNKEEYVLKSSNEEELLSYLGEYESNNKFYEDPYVEDYISQIICRIYPEKLGITNFDLNITPKLVNDPKTKIQPLANGFLIIGIDFLAKQKKEEDLIFEITKGIAHIILKNGTININRDSYGTNPLGLTFNSFQSKAAEDVAKSFIQSKKDDTNLGYFLSERGFLSKLSGIINYVAWQEFYSNHLQKSIDLLNGLIEKDLAVEETYFLKAKILRQTSNNYQSNMEALELLDKAEKNRVHGYMDIYKEKGLVLLRLGRVDEAAEAFQQYKIALGEQPVPDPIKIKWCNYMLFRCSGETGETAKLN